MVGVASIITARPSQPNAQAEVQEVKQPLLGSAQQTSPSTSSTPQAVANLEATEKFVPRLCHCDSANKPNSAENLEVFLLSMLHFCIRLGLVVIFVGCYISRLCLFLDQGNPFLNFALGAPAR